MKIKKRNVLYLVLLNLTIALSLCFLTFMVLDWYNPLMGFTTNAVSMKLLMLFCLTAMGSSGWSLVHMLKRSRRIYEKEEKKI